MLICWMTVGCTNNYTACIRKRWNQWGGGDENNLSWGDENNLSSRQSRVLLYNILPKRTNPKATKKINILTHYGYIC